MRIVCKVMDERSRPVLLYLLGLHCVTLSQTTTTEPSENITETQTSRQLLTCDAANLIENGLTMTPGSKIFYPGDNITASCSSGHLGGLINLNCAENGEWHPSVPTCTPDGNQDKNTQTTTPVFRRVFSEYKEWAGVYMYKGKPYHIQLFISDETPFIHEYIQAYCIAGSAKFYLQGFQTDNKTVFVMSHLLQADGHFQKTSWNVSGSLTRVNEQWTYSGHVGSPNGYFSTLLLHPYTPSTGHAHVPGADESVEGSLTALILGVIIAVVAIFIAAILAAVCVRKRKLTSNATIRTLSTSFENPIYDYDQTSTLKLEERALNIQQ